jgi:hypothetical protein
MVFSPHSSPNTPDMLFRRDRRPDRGVLWPTSFPNTSVRNQADADAPSQALQGTVVALREDGVVVEPSGARWKAFFPPEGLKETPTATGP